MQARKAAILAHGRWSLEVAQWLGRIPIPFVTT